MHGLCCMIGSCRRIERLIDWLIDWFIIWLINRMSFQLHLWNAFPVVSGQVQSILASSEATNQQFLSKIVQLEGECTNLALTVEKVNESNASLKEQLKFARAEHAHFVAVAYSDVAQRDSVITELKDQLAVSSGEFLSPFLCRRFSRWWSNGSFILLKIWNFNRKLHSKLKMHFVTSCLQFKFDNDIFLKNNFEYFSAMFLFCLFLWSWIPMSRIKSDSFFVCFFSFWIRLYGFY